MVGAAVVALAGCGVDGPIVVVHTVTVYSNGPHGAAADAASGPGAVRHANTASAATVASATSETNSGVGDAMLGPAALTAAVAWATGAGAATSSSASVSARTPTPTTPTTSTVASAPHHHKPSAPAAPRTTTITANATGDYAVAHVNGSFRSPSQLTLNVNSTPAQNGTVFWTITCSENGGGVGHKQAEVKVGLPLSTQLPIPAPSTSCIASANVQIAKTGSVTISISG
jgi:hypothetical protein